MSAEILAIILFIAVPLMISYWLGWMNGRRSGAATQHQQESKGVPSSVSPASINVEFNYVDGEGRISSRLVTITSFEINPNGEVSMITGLCHLRGEERSFNIHRMSRIMLNNNPVTQNDLCGELLRVMD